MPYPTTDSPVTARSNDAASPFRRGRLAFDPDRTPPAPGTSNADAPRQRIKLWGLPTRLHCPLIGTCFDAASLRRLARKVRLRDHDSLGDYALHAQFVNAARERNTVSQATHKTLEKSHATVVRRFARLRGGEALLQAWRASLRSGDVAGPMWALLTHPDSDECLRTTVYEDVHMLSHQLGAGQRAELSRFADTEAALAELRERHEALRQRSRGRREEHERQVRTLEAELADERRAREKAERSAREASAQLAGCDAQALGARCGELSKALARSRDQAGELTADRDHWQAACETQRQEHEALLARHQDTVEELRALERLVRGRLALDDDDADSDADDADLAGRAVLYVGGMHRLVDHYRALVERCNGQFHHHDGGREDSRARLEAMMSAVDTVFCATDCVSHDACLRLKRFCKHHAKRYVMLPSSGLSSFARAIASVSVEDVHARTAATGAS